MFCNLLSQFLSVCLNSFTLEGGRDLHLTRVGRSFYPLHEFWDVVSHFGHVRAINDSGNQLAYAELFLPISHTRFWTLRCSPFSPRAIIVVCICLLVLGLSLEWKWSGKVWIFSLHPLNSTGREGISQGSV